MSDKKNVKEVNKILFININALILGLVLDLENSI